MVTSKKISATCDFCSEVATYDGKLKQRTSWAYMCDVHFEQHADKTPGTFSALVSESTVSKVCSSCRRRKPIEEYRNYTDGWGHPRQSPRCKACEKKGK